MKLSGKEFRDLDRKAVTLIGMSGVGKTTLARKLPNTSWFHFSADYRIGTRYLVEPILDNIKEKAMGIDFLRDLLRSDSIYIGSAMTFDNLELLSKYVGKLGDSKSGGLPLTDFKHRQKMHCEAEVQSMLDVGEFIGKAKSIYGYEHFVNDCSGSICELNDNRVFEHLAEHTLILYLASSSQLEQTVIERQISHPKPLFYDSDFLDGKLRSFMETNGYVSEQQINPDQFVQWIFPALVEYRRPKYEAIASRYGYTIPADSIESIRDEQDFVDLVCEALESSDE
ncbi:MAG: hypothetical protein OXI60_08450 [Acidiferrobacterales bacterium]|nr:hypothetical protein [Acidiferrobacterales bacterium]